KGPARNEEEWDHLLDDLMTAQGGFYYAIVDKDSGKALGTFSLMRIDEANRVIEVGAVTYSPALQKTRMATEAQYLLARYVFEGLGYRRYEWKCDALNLPSRRAAERLGFVYEGTFRQAVIYKGRTRDTDWLSMIDK
ncbi:GNAT family N-acetyltransferase, partial [Campylobacter jejuni]|uniref:GNAT family N-acetyltransferase n=1 Tax=Campylobacter jejuni TaxID=197 RepID=UPI003B7A70AF